MEENRLRDEMPETTGNKLSLMILLTNTMTPMVSSAKVTPDVGKLPAVVACRR